MMHEQQGSEVGMGFPQQTKRITRRKRRLIIEAAHALLGTLTLEAVLAQISTTLSSVVPYSWLGLYTLDHAAQLLRPIPFEHSNWITPEYASWTIPLGQGIAGAAASSGQAMRVNDAQDDPRSLYLPNLPIMREHLLALPLHTQGEVSGLLLISRSDTQPFSKAEFEHAQLFANFLSLAISNARLFAKVEQREEQFRILSEDAHIGVIIQGSEAEILYANGTAHTLLGLSADQLAGRTSLDAAWDVVHEDGKPFPGEQHPVPQAIATRTPVRDVVMGVYHPLTNTRTWLQVNATPHLYPDGSVRQVTCTFTDISARRQAELALRAAEQRYRVLIEQIPAFVYVSALDAASTTLYISPQVQRILGLSADEWMRDPARWEQMLHPDDRARAMADLALTQRTTAPVVSEYRLMRPDGRIVWVHDESQLILDEQQPQYLQGIVVDITAQRQAEAAVAAMNIKLAKQVETLERLQEQLREQAVRDPLTGLFNRRYLDEVLRQDEAQRNPQAVSHALLLLDIDHFKRINDSFGHAAGDSVLRAVGIHIEQNIRASDIACRYGGEEFVLRLLDVTSETAYLRAEELRLGLGRLVILHEDQRLPLVTMSIGIALSSPELRSGHALLAAADTALYQAKSAGRNCCCVADDYALRSTRHSPDA